MPQQTPYKKASLGPIPDGPKVARIRSYLTESTGSLLIEGAYKTIGLERYTGRYTIHAEVERLRYLAYNECLRLISVRPSMSGGAPGASTGRGFYARARCCGPGVGGYGGGVRGVAPRTRWNGPRKGRSGPRLGPSAPRLGCRDGGGTPFCPRMGRSGPLMGAPAPLLGRTAPEMGLTGPSVGQAAPLVGASVLLVGRTAPTEGLAGPSMGRTAPLGGPTGPVVGRSGPLLGQKLPPGETPASFRQEKAAREGLRGCLERRPPHCRDAPWGVSRAADIVPAPLDAPTGAPWQRDLPLRLGDAPRGVSTVGSTEPPLSGHPLSS